jgi:transcription initiation factor TFIIH subunit 1
MTGEIPENLFRQMTTCQTAANEFLRQFWSAVCPPPADAHAVGAPPTPAQRTAKAGKMAGYLAKTHDKVDALVRAAQAEGGDPKSVQIVSPMRFLFFFLG